MIKANILVLGILATILGIYGQGISLFMYENIAKMDPLYYLIGLTMISIFLYIVTPELTYISIKKNKKRVERSQKIIWDVFVNKKKHMS